MKVIKKFKKVIIPVFMIALVMIAIMTLGVSASANDNSKCVTCDTAYENGFCSCEGTASYQPIVDSDEDGYYEIGNAGQLYYFAEMLKDFDTYSINAILTADIVVNEKVIENGVLVSDTSNLRLWESMGRDRWYSQHFEGNGHTVSGLYCISDSESAAFFHQADAQITNLGIIDSYFENTNTDDYTASLVGNADYAVINNCFSTAVVKGGENVGGLICYTTSNALVTNSYFAGSVEGNAKVDAFSHYDSAYSFENCFYLAECGSSSVISEAVSKEKFSSGYVTYNLNLNCEDDGIKWYQTVGEGYPSFVGSEVYASAPCPSTFSNVEGSLSEVQHNYVDLSGNNEHYHWSRACENCKEPEDPEEHTFKDSDVCECGYLHLFKIVSSDGTVEYVTSDYGFDNLESGTVVYLLQDFDFNEEVSFGSIGVVFDLNGFEFNSNISTNEKTIITDSSSAMVGALNGTLYAYSEVVMTHVRMSENSKIYTSTNGRITLDNVVVEAKDFHYSSNTECTVRILNAEFPYGIYDDEYGISSFLAENGYFLDANREKIDLEGGEIEIKEFVSIATDVASVTVGESTTYYTDFNSAWYVAFQSDGAVIKLLHDVDPYVKELGLACINNSNVTLDLAGKSINLTTFSVGAGSLTVEDSSEEQTGVINSITGLTGIHVTSGNATWNGGTLATNIVVSEGGSFTVNGGKIGYYQINVSSGTVTVNDVDFFEGAYLSDNSENDNAIFNIYGGEFALIYVSGGTLADFFTGNYMPQLESGKYFTDFSSNKITEPFTVVEHEHSFMVVHDENNHWYECECELVDTTRPKDIHSGGTATCDLPKMCQVCESYYGTSLGHSYGEYVSAGDGTHYRVCINDETHVETNDCHTESNHEVCGERAVCDDCNTAYGNPLEHDFSGEYVFADGKHYHECQRFGCDVTEAPESCTPGEEATCTDHQICTVCYGVLVKKKGHVEGTAATCTDAAICSVCEESYGDALDHEYVKGDCIRCDENLAFRIVVNSYGEYYTNDIRSFFMSADLVDKIEITLLMDTDVSGSAFYFTSGDVIIDLAGHSLSGFAGIIAGANVTVNDSSAEKTGAIIPAEDSALTIIVAYGNLTLNGGAIYGGLISAGFTSSVTINGGSIRGILAVSAEINGGIFENVLISVEDGITVLVKGGTFTNVSVAGSDDVTLASVFGTAACISYVDADGNSIDVDLTGISYDGTFTVVHDDSHANTDSYLHDLYRHWFECENGVATTGAAHTFGDNAACTLCGSVAPFVVEANGKLYGYFNFGDAIDAAVDFKVARITLNDDAYYVKINSYLSSASNLIGVNITVDLNGKTLSMMAEYVDVVDSTVTVTDGSEEKDGTILLNSSVYLYNSVLNLNDVMIDGYAELDINESYLLLDGVTFTNEVEMYYGYASSVAVVDVSFEYGIYVYFSDENYDLNDIFALDCMIVLDANGDALVFDYGECGYYEAFSVTHDDSYMIGVTVSNGNGMHWTVCSYCSIKGDYESCSGGAADCGSGAVCEKCNTEYTEALGHVYGADGVCKTCSQNAQIKVSDGTREWFFGDAYDAFKKADSLDNATITLLSSYNGAFDKEINLKSDRVITLDLNGHTFVIDEINIYGVTLVITDSSKNGSGVFDTVSTLDIYAGALVIDDGYFSYIEIDLDPEDGEVALIINGGTFEYIDVDTDSDYYDITFKITDGVFIEINFDLDDYAMITIVGGEYYHVSSNGSYYYYIDEIIYADCVIAIGEYGERVRFDSAEYYDGYFKLVHNDEAFEDAELYYDYKYHWYECYCGIVLNKQAHSGGTATCEDPAVCDVCEEEYGMPVNHKYDENLVCETCEDEAEGSIKVDLDGYVYYTDDINSALFAGMVAEKLVITLLEDYDYYDDYVYVYYGNDIVLDLNGYTLSTDEIYISGATLVITDSSEAKTGKVYVDYSVYLGGKLVIRGGTFNGLNVSVDTDVAYPELIVEDGIIEYLNVRTSSPQVLSFGNGGYSYVDDRAYGLVEISGGKIKAMSVMISYSIDIILKGGEFTEGFVIYDTSGRDLTLGDMLPAGCYAYYSEDGTKIDSLAASRMVLGYIKVVHTDSYTSSNDDVAHYDICLCGEKKNVEEHEYSGDCDADCNVCGSEREAIDHAYDNACDGGCNVCGAERVPASHVYDNNCDVDCNVCSDKRAPAPHVYDNDCDFDCNVCSAEREVKDHVFGDTEVVSEPTRKDSGEGRATCTVCGSTVNVAIPKLEGISSGAVVAITAAGTTTVLLGSFSLVWFVIKKKKWSDLVAAFKKSAD